MNGLVGFTAVGFTAVLLRRRHSFFAVLEFGRNLAANERDFLLGIPGCHRVPPEMPEKVQGNGGNNQQDQDRPSGRDPSFKSKNKLNELLAKKIAHKKQKTDTRNRVDAVGQQKA